METHDETEGEQLAALQGIEFEVLDAIDCIHHDDHRHTMPPAKQTAMAAGGDDEDEDPSQLHVDGMSSSRTTNSREKLRLCQVSEARRLFRPHS